jgi:hypothetical protein
MQDEAQLKSDYFTSPRFEVIATYPDSKKQVGSIISPSTEKFAEEYSSYPHLYRRMEWYEQRGISTLMEIKFIEVINSNYFRKGDKLRVVRFIFDRLDTMKPIIVGFVATYQQRTHKEFKLEDCIPADYEALNEE